MAPKLSPFTQKIADQLCKVDLEGLRIELERRETDRAVRRAAARATRLGDIKWPLPVALRHQHESAMHVSAGLSGQDLDGLGYRQTSRDFGD